MRSRLSPPFAFEGAAKAFTLVEALVSMVILVVIMGVLLSMTKQAATVYQSSNGKIESFEAAQNGFESITRTLSLATLNNYYDYVDGSGARLSNANAGTFVPVSYAKVSDLHFISGQAGFTNLSSQCAGTHAVFFQAPLGYSSNASYQRLDRMLNACGYFIHYGSDAAPTPLFAGTPRDRYQLMEFIQPAENLRVYSAFSPGLIDTSTGSETNWFNSDANNYLNDSSVVDVHVLARNILCLVILPQVSPGDTSHTSLTTDYNYDSRATAQTATWNLLPPIVAVTMVAIDEASASRLNANATMLSGLQSTVAGLFSSPSQMSQDLQTLQNVLNTDRLNYRVFQSEVALKSSKF